MAELPMFADGLPAVGEPVHTQRVWSPGEMTRRLDALQALMGDRGVEAFVAQSVHNVVYYTGVYVPPFGRPATAVIPRRGAPVLIASTIEDVRPLLGAYHDEVRLFTDWERPAPDATVVEIAAALADLGVRRGRLGIERDAVSLAFADRLTTALPGLELVDLARETMCRRLMKSAEELELMRTGVEVSARAAWAVLEVLEPGRTEVELARHGATRQEEELRARLPAVECDGSWCWVQSGPYRTRVVHQLNAHRPVARGELVTVNPFTSIAGYYHVVQRTLGLGGLSPRARELARATADALAAGVAEVRAGVPAARVDAAVEAAYREHGLGRAQRPFGAGYSCGIMGQWYGREEGGELRPYNDAPLEENMVLGVTPMVNEPGLGGVRLHDTVVVEPDGAYSLDPFPKGALAFTDGVLTCDDVPVAPGG